MLLPVLQTLFERARAAHPQLRDGVSIEVFREHVTRVVAQADDPQRALDTLHAEDLFFVCAALQSHPLALPALQERVVLEVSAAVRRQPAAAALADDVSQQLLAKLLLSERPKLLEYSARGPLGAWLRASALGMALNLVRADRPDRTALDEFGSDEDLSIAQDTPEVAYLRSLCHAEFNEAFTQALATLELKERRVIRLRFLDGLTLEELAVYFRVHRATVVRWLAEVTQRLFDETRRQLSERLTLAPTEVDSLLRAARSIDFSLKGLLREASALDQSAS